MEQGQWVHIVYRPAAIYTTASAYTAVVGRREGDIERMLFAVTNLNVRKENLIEVIILF